LGYLLCILQIGITEKFKISITYITFSASYDSGKLSVSEPSLARHQNLVVSLIVDYCGISITICAENDLARVQIVVLFESP